MDEYMRESGGVKKSRGGRGPGGARLKVRAVIVKRTSGPKGPTGGGRGGRGRGLDLEAPPAEQTRPHRPRVGDAIVRASARARVRSDAPRTIDPAARSAARPTTARVCRATSRISQRERVHKREDGFVAVHIYGKDVILVAPTGEVRLDAAGDTGHNTFRAMNESLNKFGFKLSKPERRDAVDAGRRQEVSEAVRGRYDDPHARASRAGPGAWRAHAERRPAGGDRAARAGRAQFGARSFAGRAIGGRGRGFGARGAGGTEGGP